MNFELRTEWIALDNLLKASGVVGSGGQAKTLVQSGAVRVNGVKEDRLRRKIKKGDQVETQGETILVM